MAKGIAGAWISGIAAGPAANGLVGQGFLPWGGWVSMGRPLGTPAPARP
jgi:hypothetical protein